MAELNVEALVLAGGDDKRSEEYRPLRPLAGYPMVTYVVKALRQCPAVQRLGVAGPRERLAGLWEPEIELVPGGNNLIDTLEKGLDAFQPRTWLLVATADVPLLTPVAVGDFLARCTPLLARYDFFYSIVERRVYEAFCPGGRRTYVHLREGSFTGGNLFLVRPEVAVPACRRGADIMRLRKSPVRLARLIGPWFLLRFLLRRLSLAEAEARFSSLLGLRGVTVPVPHAAVGFDLDHPEDFVLAEGLLQKGF
ncbi:MAG: NTP transferase domain-containing protein [Clostridia bacterium]|nr:NTP transferase domain-containing protein [Clostridia bacterium]